MIGLTLTACASAQPGADAGDAVGGSARVGTPQPVAGYDWFFETDGTEVKMAFGLAESEDLALALSCRAGSGRLAMKRIAPVGTTDIHLESGGDTERFSAIGEVSPQDDGVFLTAEANANSPLFQRFRRVGWLAIWQDGRRETLVPQQSSKPNVERFFALCG